MKAKRAAKPMIQAKKAKEKGKSKRRVREVEPEDVEPGDSDASDASV